MRAHPTLQLLAATLLLAASCRGRSAADLANGDDPLAALRSPQRSAVYDAAFWAREFHRKTPAWRAAAAYCAGHAQAPNCHPVRLAQLWEAPPPFEEVFRVVPPGRDAASAPPPRAIPPRPERDR